MKKQPINKSGKYNVVIVGRPNVGKSSLFNRIIGLRKAVVLKEPGTTRDILEYQLSKEGKIMNLIDTAGYYNDKDSEIHDKSQKKVKEAISLAEILILVVDGEVPPTEEDKEISDFVRKSGKKTLLVINKIDSSKKLNYANEYKRLGFKSIYEISTIHNIGVTKLIIDIFKNAPKSSTQTSDKEQIKVTILGRPNVGKSSILNALCKKDRSIVTAIAGTTRDIVSENIRFNEKEIKISDTAGTRRPGKVGRAFKKGAPLERFAFLRTQREIQGTDIVLLILDATEKRATTQDLHIAGYAKEAGKGIILVINKWDMIKNIEQEKFLNHLRNRFSFITWVPAIFVSAKTGLNIEKIPEIVLKVSENQRRQLKTSLLNRIIEDFANNNLPKARGKIRPKVFYGTQTGIIPPTFEIRAKHSEAIHFSWKRALINELRKNFDFTGTPIRIFFKKK